MLNYKQTQANSLAGRLLSLFLGLSWLEVPPDLLKSARYFWEKLTDSGMYEVLEYDSTLELLDEYGYRARFSKREKIRYLQNNIIAYQDQAWGDGQILIGYRCSPGKVVDRYRPGKKTYLLISLRGIRNRGDVDKFSIEWRIHDGFTRKTELWETEVSHRTKRMRVHVVFPKTRPPIQAWLVEEGRRRTQRLDQEAKMVLSDGRWQLSWEKRWPRLNERYQLHWNW